MLAALRSARSFEAAARALLDELILMCDAAAHSRYRQRIVKRATLHLRPGGYQGLFVRTQDEADAEAVTDSTWLSSVTAWKYISRSATPLEIDLARGVVTKLTSQRPMQAATEESTAEFDGPHTLMVLRARKTTHLLVLPVVAVHGGVVGQICVELQCSGVIHSPFMWLDCLAPMTDLVALAGPYLVALPSDGTPDRLQEWNFPVVGKTMAPILRLLRTFARHNETILLRGSTGTGKSRLARWCHDASHRAAQPFEVVSLNAVAADLQVSTLFGWRRGAFTGATGSNKGAVQRAAGGTLFLDEIDKLELPVQKALLRLIEERRFLTLGGDKEEEADVRFIVGTNADLERATQEGRFLLDLYYRINVLPVRLPDLAERADEIGGWARYMVHRCATQLAVPATVELDPDAVRPLEVYHWPGNLRQLDNVVRRAVLLAVSEADATPDRPLGVSRAHVQSALMMEQSVPVSEGCSSTLDLLRASARGLVKCLPSEPGSAATELLDLAGSAFKGLTLLEAIAQFSDTKEAFEALGMSKTLESRNHQRMLAAARKNVESLRAYLELTRAGKT